MSDEEVDLLETQFDREKKQRKLQRAQKEQAASRTKLLREQRAKWQCPESDCLLYANLMVDYFNFMRE